MRPTDLPPSVGIVAGKRLAAVHRAHALLQYAAVRVLDEDQAVAHAVRLLRGPKLVQGPRRVRVPAQDRKS